MFANQRTKNVQICNENTVYNNGTDINDVIEEGQEAVNNQPGSQHASTPVRIHSIYSVRQAGEKQIAN